MKYSERLIACVFAALLACSGAALAQRSLSSPAAAGWSIVASPNDSAEAHFLTGVACLSAADCWAVGRTSSVGKITIIEHWDGASWRVVPSPDGPGTLINILSGVACAATNDCWAVGYYATQALDIGTLKLHWDGSSWTILPGAPSRKALYGVACTSSSNCWAVGFDNTGSASRTLIERWDGSAWTVVASPNASATEGNVLNAIACASPADCWAVGSYQTDAGATSTLAEHWDGSAWTVVASPDAGSSAIAGGQSVLVSVTCPAAANCWAVGYYDVEIVDPFGFFDPVRVAQTLIEHWDGSAWSIVTSPNPGAVATVDNYLAGVTCTSASACWAVGYSNDGNVDSSLVLVWNGTAWLPGTMPGVPASDGRTLAGVACASPSSCWAIGTLVNGWSKGLIEHWDGTAWLNLTAPKVPTKPSDFLYSVTCVAKSDCWAVGFWFASSVARTLTLHWDGSAWTIVPSPNVNETDNHYLGDVTCLSASNCWAVGSRTDNIGLSARTLILHWDGTSWSIVSSAPDTSTAEGLDLEAVSCVSASECMAVGFARGSAGDHGFAMRWDGASWSVAPVPPTTQAEMFYTPSDYLYDVACPGAADCWAAGAHWTGTVYQTLLFHWDGSAWTLATSPNTATDQDNILSAVTCTSAADCWAVGSFDAYRSGLLVHWNGTAWSIIPAPQADDPLNAVTCVSASECWAAGPYYTPSPPAQTLLMRWDGTSWTKVASPNSAANQSNTLSGLACTSSSDCWTVGRYSANASSNTLTLHYTLRPTAVLSADPTSTTTGTSVSFDGTGSSTPNIGDTIASFTFDFGDSTPAVTQAGATIGHAYSAAGTFTASLTVTDNHGLASVNLAQVEITVVSAATGLDFYTLTPCRVLDTRQAGGALSSGVARSLAIAGACGIPATAKAVSFNLTAIAPSAAGSIAFYPDPGAPPLQGTPETTGTINFNAAQTRANNQVLALAVVGDGSLQAQATLPGSGSVHVVVDVNGYFQ